MKNFIIATLISIVLIPTAAQARNVSFASFNLFWLFNEVAPHKKWWDEQRGEMGQTYQQALSLLAVKIKEFDTDVLAVQEIENEAVLDDLIDKLSSVGLDYDHTWISKGADNTTGQDVAILSKFPAFSGESIIREYPNERESYLTENDRGNEDDMRLSKALRVDLNINGQQIPIFVFHLKSQRGGIESDNQRLAQASIVRRITLPLIKDDMKFVVMGDLNADRGSPTLLRLRGFDDIYADLVQPVHNDKFSGDKWTYKYDGRTEQIDHILLSPALRKSVVSGKISYGHDDKTSDHKPIIIVLDI